MSTAGQGSPGPSTARTSTSPDVWLSPVSGLTA
jgi:hypothetical protein